MSIFTTSRRASVSASRPCACCQIKQLLFSIHSDTFYLLSSNTSRFNRSVMLSYVMYRNKFVNVPALRINLKLRCRQSLRGLESHAMVK